MKRCSASPAQVASANGAPALAALALAGALTLSGCQATSPIQTDVAYEPADGVAVDLGDVHIRNLLVVASAEGEVGTMSGMVGNSGSTPITVTFFDRANGSTANVKVPGGQTTQLSGAEAAKAVTIPEVATAPGGVIDLTVSTPADGTTEVSAPVMLPQGYYSAITPGTAETSAP